MCKLGLGMMRHEILCRQLNVVYMYIHIRIYSSIALPLLPSGNPGGAESSRGSDGLTQTAQLQTAAAGGGSLPCQPDGYPRTSGECLATLGSPPETGTGEVSSEPFSTSSSTSFFHFLFS